jgi:superfamily II DNA or RNA helicase
VDLGLALARDLLETPAVSKRNPSRELSSPLLDAIAPFLGVFSAPIAHDDLVRVLLRVGPRAAGGAPQSPATLAVALGAFVSARVLERVGRDQYRCAPLHAGRLMARLRTQGTMEALLRDGFVPELPLHPMRGKPQLTDAALGARALLHARVALHAGLEPELLDALAQYSRLAGGGVDVRAATASLLDDCDPETTEEADPTWLMAVPFVTARHVFAQRLREQALRGEPVDSTLRVVRATPSEDWGPDLAAALALVMFLRGEMGSAVAMVELSRSLFGLATPEALAVRGVVKWWGDDDTFWKAFEDALTAHRKATGVRDAGLPGELGLLHVIALLSTGDAAQMASAQRIARASVNESELGVAFGHLSACADALTQASMTSALQRWQPPSAPPRNAGGWLLLIAGLCTRWAGQRVPSSQHAAYVVHVELYKAAGWTWFADQLRGVLRAAGSHDVGVGGSLVDRVSTTTPWRDALAALGRVVGRTSAHAAQKSGEPPVGSERLVFEVDPQRGFDVQPIVQKLSKNGWSGGRRAALKTLVSTTPSYVTTEDHAVLTEIQVVTTSNYRGYSDTTYYFTQQVHEALVGHPRVRLAGNEEFVKVTRCAPTLHVQTVAGGMRLSVEGMLSGPRLDAGGQLQVVTLTDAQKRLGVTIAEHSVVYPDAAKDSLGELLGALASIIEVHAETAIGSEVIVAREVPADATPHVRLMRDGQGLVVEIRVSPLGVEGPSVVPGEGAETLVVARGREGVRTQRSFLNETAGVRALLDACPSLAAKVSAEAGVGARVQVPTLEDCLALVVELRDMGDKVVVEWPEGDPIRVKTVRPSHVNVRIVAAKDWLEPEGDVTVDGELVMEMRALLAALAERPSRFVALSDGSFLALERALATELARVAAFADVERGPDLALTVRLGTLAALSLADLHASVPIKGNPAFRKRLAAIETARERVAPIPRGLRATLRPYQEDGFRWLARLAELGVGACLADDMGLGKTLQTLALLLHRAPLGPALVTAPTSVCTGWRDEIRRFAPDLVVHSLRGAERIDDLSALGPFDVLICTHGLLPREIPQLAEVRFATAVIDEAQAFKNASTERAKAAYRLRADMRVATTGTPIENHLGELHSLFQFVEPGLLGTAHSFKKRFADPIERMGDAHARQHLRARVTPLMLRRTKTQVLDELPPRTDVLLRVEAEPEQRAFYEALRTRALDELERARAEGAAQGDQRMQVLAVLTRLRQACCHPALVAPELGLPSAKMEAFLELFDELREGGHRALVFSQFVRHLELVREQLDAREVTYQYLDGQTPEKERARRVRAFQAGEGDAFLISLKAGGTGLNLTGADYVIHLDPWWNPAVEDQATDRAHRIGQARPVTSYRLILAETVEERIVALHHQKRDLAFQLLSGADRSAKMSVADMLALLQASDGTD